MRYITQEEKKLWKKRKIRELFGAFQADLRLKRQHTATAAFGSSSPLRFNLETPIAFLFNTHTRGAPRVGVDGFGFQVQEFFEYKINLQESNINNELRRRL